MGRKFVLTVTLNPAVDVFSRIHTARDRQRDQVAPYLRTAGGKGINVARCLRKLGVSCLATGFAGGKVGKELRSRLKAEGIRHDFLPIAAETRTNLTVVDPRGKISRSLQQGPRILAKERAAFLEKFGRLLGQTSLVVLSGSLPPGLPAGFYARLIRLARRKDVPVVLDTSGPALLSGWKAKPFALKPNRSEAVWLWKRKLNSMAEIKRTVEYGVRSGVGQVLISLGSRGVYCATRGVSAYLKVPAVVPRHHSVGCGDALVGGFVAATIQGLSPEMGWHWAVAAGTASCERSIPGDLDPLRFRQYLKKSLSFNRIDLESQQKGGR